MPRARIGLHALLVAGVVMPCTGCMAPERRYEVLSIFFDGVPEPGAARTGSGPSEDAPTKGAEVVWTLHAPYAEKNCGACHDGVRSNRLRVERHLLCAICHKGDEFAEAYLHGPVATGQCYACHEPHKSTFDHLLVGPGAGICGECHTTATFGGLSRHRQEQGEDCLRCHSPHGSASPAMLRHVPRADNSEPERESPAAEAPEETSERAPRGHD